MRMATFLGLMGMGLGAHFSGRLVEKLQLPALLGMVLSGMALGPYFLDWIPGGTLDLSPLFRDGALVAVLFLGGLGIQGKQLKKIGRPAVLLSTVPALMEGFAIAIAASWWLGFSFIQGAILGFMLAAVSPAVLIPGMTALINQRLGTKKGIPQMLLVGASADDTVAITLFTLFLGLYFSPGIGLSLVMIPISILGSVAISYGVFKAVSPLLRLVGEGWWQTLLAFGICLLLRLVETQWAQTGFNSLLAVVAFGYFVGNGQNFAGAYMEKLWSIGRLFLFSFVGMLINPRLVGSFLAVGLVLLAFSLTVRSLGVLLSLVGTDLTKKERFFCVIAYLPKATVQAAKSPIPLAMGVGGGEVMEAIAILSILITAPLGAIGIKWCSECCLEKEPQ